MTAFMTSSSCFKTDNILNYFVHFISRLLFLISLISLLYSSD